MRPGTLTQGGTGTTGVFVLDVAQDPFNVTLALKFNVAGTTTSGGVGTATVQYTLDDPYAVGGYGTNTQWYNSNDSNLVAATTAYASNLAFPARAVRLTQSAGTGTSVLIVDQAGITSNG